MMNQKERTTIAEFVLDTARRAGAKEALVRISTQRNVAVEHREGNVDKLQEAVSRSLVLDLYLDGKYSSHTTQKLDRLALISFVNEAAALTKFLAPDSFRRLPEPELSKLEDHGGLQILDGKHESLETPRRIEMAREAETAARSVAGPIITASSSYSDSRWEQTVLTTAGFHGEHAETSYSLSASVTAKDGDKGRPEDYAYANVRYLSEIPSPAEIGRDAAERALAKIGQSKLPSGKYDILVENRVANNLLWPILGSMSASAIQQKSSFLDGKIGTRIGSSCLTLVDDPFVPKGLGSQRFDEDTLALHRRSLIEGGILKTYLVDNYYGRKLSLRPNSGATTNILLAGGHGSLEESLHTLGRGILVRGWIGGNCNSTTGDYSFGLMGQYVEDGKIVRPVNEMNLTGNMLDLWCSLEAVGGDPDVNNSWRMPSLLFRGLQLSGS